VDGPGVYCFLFENAGLQVQDRKVKVDARMVPD
jgi:hypothetical protein